MYDASGQLAKKSVYAGEFFYEGTTTTPSLSFINTEEGRIIPGATAEYQYHLKDHLGNVRVTFTTKPETEALTANYEQSNEEVEINQFQRSENVRKVSSHLFDRTNDANPITVSGFAQRLSGGPNERYELARSLSVMPGDKIRAEVYAKYADKNSTNQDFRTLLTNIATAISAGNTSGGLVKDGGSFSSSTSSFPFDTYASDVTSGSTGTGPRAFLNWLIFDQDYNLLDFGYDRIDEMAKESGQDKGHDRMFSPEITITKPGFVYIYLLARRSFERSREQRRIDDSGGGLLR